ncbi:MFS transporter [Yoonia maritima]|uniref:MFS transporter n=1 Tax=Yoonia maritima TaxID=1435347 RepID=UPI000D10B906|nr:MFS transporter [Yoonia maritima]
MFNRNFSLILCGNILLGAAMPMLIILGALAGGYLAPVKWMATFPPTVQLIVGVAVATPISLLMGRYGRRAGFLIAACLTIAGGALGAYALVQQSFSLLCISHIILGAGLICVNYFRFAAADVVDDQHKAQAMSVTIASGLVAALVGPQLFSGLKDLLAPVPFAGAYIGIAALGALGIIPVAALRIPHDFSKPTRATGNTVAVLRENPQVVTAIAVAAFAHAIMIFLMIPTPLAMVGCGLDEDQAASVISWHVVAMFAPGLITGKLIQKYGSTQIAISGLILLLVAAVIPLTGQTPFQFHAALIALGVGWNFGFVGGTYMLQTALRPEDRPLVQGINDMILAICAAVASLASGVVFAVLGWAMLATLAVVLVGFGIVAFVTDQYRATGAI